jgi:hypothetical protein
MEWNEGENGYHLSIIIKVANRWYNRNECEAWDIAVKTLERV